MLVSSSGGSERDAARCPFRPLHTLHQIPMGFDRIFTILTRETDAG